MQNKFSVQLQITGHRTDGNHGPGSDPSKLRTLATKKSRCWRNQAITLTENFACCKFCWRTRQMELRQSTLAQLQGRQVRKDFAHEYGEICEQNFYVYLHLLSSLTVIKYGKCSVLNVPWPMTTSGAMRLCKPESKNTNVTTSMSEQKGTTCPFQTGNPAERTAQHLSCCGLRFRSLDP